MSETKFTPGPWVRFDDGGATSTGHYYGPQFADCVWRPLGPGHGLIADCSPHGQQTSEETIANARLISAAPDLYEALERIEDWLSETTIALPRPIADKARAALAKARGAVS